MKVDDAGVGGFLEDLPVLMFVLAGVTVLLSSAVWAASWFEQDRGEESLEDSAERVLETVLSGLPCPRMGYPTAQGIVESNLTGAVEQSAQGVHWRLAIVMLYPGPEWLVSLSDCGVVTPASACSASKLLSASGPDGGTVVLEVTVVVWAA
jgi:hypothetical protein